MKPEKSVETKSMPAEQGQPEQVGDLPGAAEKSTTPGSSDSTPSPSLKGAAQISIDFTDTINGLLENPEHAAAQALGNNFQNNGIGNLGTLFRSLEKSQGLPQEEEVWSAFLDLVSTLWQKDFHEASLKLLKDSLIRLSPPDIYRNNITESISFGEDYTLYLRARHRFDQGDQEGAKGFIAQMSEDGRGEMEKELERSSFARKKSRRNAFIGAGIAGAFCLVACVGSVLTFRNLVQNPHTMEIPAFEMPSIPLGLEDPDANLGKSIQSIIPEALMDPDTYQDPISPASDPELAIDSILGNDESLPSPDQGTEDTSLPISDDSAALPVIEMEQSDQPSLGLEEEETPTPRAIDPQVVSRCGLAFRISTEVQRIVSLDENTERQGQAQSFQDAFFQACQSIPAALIQEAGGAYSEQEILDYANGILSEE